MTACLQLRTITHLLTVMPLGCQTEASVIRRQGGKEQKGEEGGAERPGGSTCTRVRDVCACVRVYCVCACVCVSVCVCVCAQACMRLS